MCIWLFMPRQFAMLLKAHTKFDVKKKRGVAGDISFIVGSNLALGIKQLILRL